MEKSIQHLLPGDIAQALCHTLIHSLWQGVLLALLTGVIMVFTKRYSASLRYRLLVSAFLLFSMALVGTLMFELKHGAADVPTVNTDHPGNITEYLTTQLNFGLKYTHEHAGIIVTVWMLIISLKSFRLLFGLYALDRLKKTKARPVTAYWAQRITELSNTLGIKRSVLLLESGISKIPVMIGYLKPVILVPIGLINSLGREEVEAILLHELAHIRRRDYLVNLLQSVIETLLFFNPAVLWLSALIRNERENCCDDIVVNYTQNKIGYVRALVHYQQHQVSAPGYTLAFGGKSSGMVPRLERLIANRNRSLNKLEVIGLAILILISTLFIAVSPSPKYQSVIKTPIANPNASKSEEEAKKKAEADAAQRTGHPGSIP